MHQIKAPLPGTPATFIQVGLRYDSQAANAEVEVSDLIWQVMLGSVQTSGAGDGHHSYKMKTKNR